MFVFSLRCLLSQTSCFSDRDRLLFFLFLATVVSDSTRVVFHMQTIISILSVKLVAPPDTRHREASECLQAVTSRPISRIKSVTSSVNKCGSVQRPAAHAQSAADERVQTSRRLPYKFHKVFFILLSNFQQPLTIQLGICFP